MDFLRAPSNFFVQCFRDFDSKDLGLRDPGKEFSRTPSFAEGKGYTALMFTVLFVTAVCFLLDYARIMCADSVRHYVRRLCKSIEHTVSHRPPKGILKGGFKSGDPTTQ